MFTVRTMRSTITISILTGMRRFIIHALFKLQFALKKKMTKSLMLFLRKTAFLVLCNRYHAEFLKLQIENTFDDKF